MPRLFCKLLAVQAGAYKELLPAEGPVRTQSLDMINKKNASTKSKRLHELQLMEKMGEYEPEFDQMLFHLPLAGSTFKKVYYDDLLGRAVSKFVPADDLIVPYSATSLEDAELSCTFQNVRERFRKQQVGGFYSDINWEHHQ